jgi:hypothetical protein
MAYEIGTASNYTDLLDKLIAFLTANTDLVAASQNWTVLRDVTVAGAEHDYLLRGPGLAGSDQIHVRIRNDSNSGADIYGLSFEGFVSYNSGVANNAQPGISSTGGMALWNNTTPYWFIANGRRFIVVAKVSTIYSSMYAGFYLPYATPSEMPYPIIVLGSHESGITHRWSQADYNVGGFWDPSSGNAYGRHNDGTWLSVENYENSGGNRNSYYANGIWPYNVDLGLRDNVDGTFTLLPTIFHSSYSGGNVYGELDGVFFTAGYGVAAEDTITIGSDTYLIVQSVYRTDRLSYAAIQLG